MTRPICALMLLLAACGSGASNDLPAEMSENVLVVPIVRVDEWQVPYISAEFDGNTFTCPFDSGAANVWKFQRGDNVQTVCVAGYCRTMEVYGYTDLADPCLVGLGFFDRAVKFELDLIIMELRVYASTVG